MPKVSVILPCYNVAPYICACLDSLVNQTLRDIEIICVDDKSTDNTLEIIQERATQDKRIKVIAQPANSGVSVARNTGIDAATGEYIGFVDPDDYVDLDFYEKLYEAATRENADIAKANLTVVNVDGIHTAGRLNRYVKQNKLNFQYEFTSAIYKRDFLNRHNLRFLPGVSIGEDVNWQIKAVYLANKIPVLDNTSYMYIRRSDSAYSTYLTRGKIEKVCEASKDLLVWTNNHPNMNHADYMNIMRSVYAMLTNNLKKCTTYQDKEFIGQCIINTYNGTRYKPDALQQNFKRYSRKAVATGNLDKMLLTLEYKKKRYKLFGCIPVIKELYAPGQEYKAMLFDTIPLFRCKRGLYNDKFYVFGMLMLKIAH
jgi:glycosyltransferase involved in cell wall biosynthesis